MTTDEAVEVVAEYGRSIGEMGQAFIDLFSKLEIRKIPVGNGRFLWVFEPKGDGTAVIEGIGRRNG
jgi:hypothetical protein